MMECVPLDITVISADDLKNVNLISKMSVYVLVSMSGDPRTKRRTPVDKNCGKNPKWNDRMSFAVDEASLSLHPNLCILFQIRSDRPLGDRDIGEVSVPIRELLDNNDPASDRLVEYQVRTPSGKPKGTLKFSYKFGEKSTALSSANNNYDEPVMAFPAHVGATSVYKPPPVAGYTPPPLYQGAPPYMHPGAYPPPPPGYGYPPPPMYACGPSGYPPAGTYGYPPQSGGYGYPPVVQPPAHQGKKKSGKGGLGLGMGAGLLGGLLVGEMISDVGEVAAYDAAFDGDF
ncbi:protein SRC2 homolog [Diospyros lotus]|uniref:protein SRC2 homolog n=1 Tax=Diospyros lotus TaxID=55363 RepID=UPI00224E2BE1|nr:protein SRC2 homolog [Diospyros lotus]